MMNLQTFPVKPGYDARVDAQPKLRRLLPEEVAAQIQAKILDGSFAPGDRLPPERVLASQLRVNRSSVREALKRLEELRLVDIQQGSGTRVRDAEHASFEIVWNLVFPAMRENLTHIRELLELREALLPGVLRLGLVRASQAELDAVVAEVRRIADPALSAEEFVDGLRELQVVVARLAHNRVVVILANSMTRFLAQRSLVREMAQLIADRRPVVPLLQRFAYALAARDAETAEKVGCEIVRRVTRILVSAVERTPEGGPAGEGPGANS
jgi:DNA-binding FadR family transcriptional regulator